MICRIEGVLESVAEGVARVDPGQGLTYELLVSAWSEARLAGLRGQRVLLHTIQYLEGSGQGANLTPRLVGFLSEADRAFYQHFTSVKGIGPRKALRAMSLSTARIAAAIADRDLKTLQALPEVGRRASETIVAALHGRIDRFLEGVSRTGEAEGPGAAPDGREPAQMAAREALEVLVQLGESRTQALTWIDQVMRREPELADAQELVAAVLRQRAGV